MKHFFFSFLAVVLSLAALMVSCVDEPGVLQEVDITSICCTIPRIDVEEDFATGKLDTLIATKATFSGANFLWSEGDKIGIVPSSGAQIYFEVNDGAGTSSASFQGGDWALKSTGTFYAYYPLYNDVFLSKDHVLVSYVGQTQSGNDNNLHTGNYWTLYTEGTTAVGNNLNFSFNHLTAFFKTYVTVPAGTYTKITFTAPSEVFIKDGYFDLSAETPTIVGTTFTNELSLDLQNVTFTEETELTGYLVVAPINIAGIPITVTVYKEGEPAYEYTLTKANPMVAAKTYAFRATSLTQLASSATQANELFASGATSVTITEPLTENATIVLPNTSEDVTLTLPTTESTATLTISYDPGAASYPSTLSLTGHEGSDLDIQTPNSTVTVNGVAYDQITSRTAANTCIIPVGVTVNNLKVVQGGVQVYGTVTQIDLSEQEDDAIITVSGTVSTLLGEDDEEYAPATGVSLSQAAIILETGENVTLAATVAPAGAYPNVVWSSSDETVATVSTSGVVIAVTAGYATIIATTISGGFTATCSITVVPRHEYVDLGLSVKWATCNIGAAKPEDYGDYYAWGETETKSNYSWSTYKYGNSSSSLTKYNSDSSRGTVDNKTTLEPSDDAARTKWGGFWRMPTRAEQEELLSNCTMTMTTIGGKSGYRLTSKKNGNSIFLPCAGARYNDSLYDAGSYGDYWSSSLNTGIKTNAFGIEFNSSYRHCTPLYRYYGCSIRPVLDQGKYIIILDQDSLSLKVGETTTLTSTVSPSDATTVTWSSSNAAVATVSSEGVVTGVNEGTAHIIATTIASGDTARCVVTVVPIPVPEAIDLGLSVKWASFNVGASTPEEYGDYFSWGETEPKENYSWSAYKFGYGESWSPLTKYNTLSSKGAVDNKTTLEPSDDAASVQWGGSWRMPTDAELEELLNNCSCTWTTRNGVYGSLVTSTKNGNSIFFPAAGYRFDSSLSSDGTYGSGFYWSSSIIPIGPSMAIFICFSFPDGSGHCNEYGRCAGMTVRPVCP